MVRGVLRFLTRTSVRRLVAGMIVGLTFVDLTLVDLTFVGWRSVGWRFRRLDAGLRRGVPLAGDGATVVVEVVWPPRPFRGEGVGASSARDPTRGG